MGMLLTLFPNFSNFPEDIPILVDLDSPWSIFDPKRENNLIKQIEDLNINSIFSNINFPENVYIHPNAVVDKNARIEGPCYIGDGAVVKHSAYLRPGSCICKGAVVGHSTEIKNSILLPYSKASHFNYVGDSIIGCYTNLGAGVKIANVRNDKNYIIIKGENVLIHTNLKKFGSLIGDNSSLGCNSVCNPGSVLHPESSFSPNSVISGVKE